MSKIVELIFSQDKTKGTGQTNETRIRIITQLFSKDGELILEYDPAPERGGDYIKLNHKALIDACKGLTT